MKTKNNFLFAFAFVLALLAGQNAFSQCTLVGTDSNGNVQNSTPISCDFPVQINTGDPNNDDQDFINQKDAWLNAHPGDVDAFGTAGEYFYIEIHQVDFDAMSADRQAAILQNTVTYHIIQ